MPGKRTQLHHWHESNNAQFTDVGGWEVPAVFGNEQTEYAALRNNCALIDLGHLARYRINGVGRVAWLDQLATINVEALPVNRVAQGFLCNDRGGIIDWVAIYKDEQYLLINGHPANRLRVIDWFRENSEKHLEAGIDVVDNGSTHSQFEVRGPQSRALMEAVFTQPMTLNENEAFILATGNMRSLVWRRRFCGTDGYVLTMGAVHALPLWEMFVSMGKNFGARVIGVNATNLMRIEGGFGATGAELGEDVTPPEVGLNSTIDYKKHHFVGKRALLHSSAFEFPRRMVLLKTNGQVAPPVGAPVCMGTMPVGVVTSAALSFGMRAGIALGFVDASKAQAGTRLFIRAETQSFEAEVTDSPFR